MAFLKAVFHFSSSNGRAAYVSTTFGSNLFLCDSTALVACSMILMNGAGVIFEREVGGRIATDMASPILVYICAVISAAQRQWKGR